jgi:hypothetical protein
LSRAIHDLIVTKVGIGSTFTLALPEEPGLPEE